MTIIEPIILGVVQGITEFLPISSSGHLIIFPELLGWQEHSFDFDVMIHVATLLAVIWVLRQDLKKIILSIFSKNQEGILGWKIVAATIPVIVVGLVISGSFLDSVRTVKIVAVNLILWGAVLWAADWYSEHANHKVKKIKKVKWLSAIIIGFSQAIALLPGVSRSGITISTGLFAGLDRTTAAKFSFLLAIPAILGAGVIAWIDASQNGGFHTPLAAMVAGFITAFVAGCAAIKLLLKFLTKSNYTWFAVYRIVLGLILFFLVTL